MLLDIFYKLIAMTGDDQLGVCEVVTFKNSLSDSTSMVMVDRIDGIIEDDNWTADAFRLGHQDCQSETANMSLTKNMERIDANIRIALKTDFDLA
ncbi:hypothetical protein, partial [Stenotrophomonas sp. Ste71]|uniref:hypothetical protein n=1 Tax=Stenotrophomonas sp. Ste71 TaxID=2926027 RepID=UPI0021191F2F